MSAGDPLGLSGTVLHEQFRVGELSDASRRSYVYKGSQIALGTPVALKFLRVPEAFASEAFLKRFRHETRLHYALAQASPNIVRVLAGGTAVLPSTGARVPFSVLEWLQGRTLAADFAERRAHWGKGRTIQEAITLLDPAVEALSSAHKQGVVHREVSPANLFLCETGDGSKLKVLDFGLAKVSSDALPAEAGRAQTVDMGPLASPIYAAPEQFSREAGAVGPETDLYSLMMIFLEALRDRAVMDDSNLPLAVRVLDKHKRPTPKSLGIDVGENLELAVTEALAVRSKDRPKDIAEYWDHLKKAALKDARAMAISAPPRLHARNDGGEDDATEVQINVSFLRHSQAPTVPHPEPETLSRPDIDEEPLSTSGELFAMQIPPTKRSERPPPATLPQREKTLVSPGQVSPGQPPVPKFHPNATLPTMVSAQPKLPAVTFASDPQASSAAPFELSKNTAEPPPTPVMPLAPPAAPEAPGAPIWVSVPKPASIAAQSAQPARPMPWLMMLIVFFIAVIALAIVAIILLR